jgi:hypothetical protein
VALYPRQISGLPAWAVPVAGAVPYRIRYRLLGEASWLGWPRRAVLPSSALRSPSQLAGGLLLASVGAPALPAAEARFAERTDWLARPRPTPGGRRAASIAQSTRLLLSTVILLRTVVRWWHTGSRQMSVCLSKIRDKIRLLGFTTLHDSRRYAIPRCLDPSHPDTKARCSGDGEYLILSCLSR